MATVVQHGREEDAEDAVSVLRRSIAELCKVDYHDDAEELAGWLANKTVNTYNVWVNRSDAAVFVAEIDGVIQGVGMIDVKGEVLLNYVSPDARFKGVSKALLSKMEKNALSWGLKRCFLESTRTAKSFYDACGYKSINGAGSYLYLEKML